MANARHCYFPKLDLLVPCLPFTSATPLIYSRIIEATTGLLGVILDQNLSWIPHLKEVIRKKAIQVSTKRCVPVFLRLPNQPSRMRCSSGEGLITQDNTSVLPEYFWFFTGRANGLLFSCRLMEHSNTFV